MQDSSQRLKYLFTLFGQRWLWVLVPALMAAAAAWQFDHSPSTRFEYRVLIEHVNSDWGTREALVEQVDDWFGSSVVDGVSMRDERPDEGSIGIEQPASEASTVFVVLSVDASEAAAAERLENVVLQLLASNAGIQSETDQKIEQIEALAIEASAAAEESNLAADELRASIDMAEEKGSNSTSVDALWLDLEVAKHHRLQYENELTSLEIEAAEATARRNQTDVVLRAVGVPFVQEVGTADRRGAIALLIGLLTGIIAAFGVIKFDGSKAPVHSADQLAYHLGRVGVPALEATSPASLPSLLAAAAGPHSNRLLVCGVGDDLSYRSMVNALLDWVQECAVELLAGSESPEQRHTQADAAVFVVAYGAVSISDLGARIRSLEYLLPDRRMIIVGPTRVLVAPGGNQWPEIETDLCIEDQRLCDVDLIVSGRGGAASIHQGL